MKTFSGLPASQNEHELGAFIKLVNQYRCASYLEIGSRDGDTFHAVMSALPKGSRGVAVDLPGGAWGRDSKANLTAAVEDLRANGYRVGLIFGDSTSQQVIDRVALVNYDAILIDGDHQYNGVKADYDNYAHMAAKLVAFHDIAGHGVTQKRSGLPVEVPRFWDEIKQENSLEIIDCNSKMGIGVLLL